MGKLVRGEKFPDAYVAAWEGRNGQYHVVYDEDGKKVGREPTDHSVEMARRVAIRHGNDFYTVEALTSAYNIDEAIQEILDYYSGD